MREKKEHGSQNSRMAEHKVMSIEHQLNNFYVGWTMSMRQTEPLWPFNIFSLQDAGTEHESNEKF